MSALFLLPDTTKGGECYGRAHYKCEQRRQRFRMGRSHAGTLGGYRYPDVRSDEVFPVIPYRTLV